MEIISSVNLLHSPFLGNGGSVCWSRLNYVSTEYIRGNPHIVAVGVFEAKSIQRTARPPKCK